MEKQTNTFFKYSFKNVFIKTTCLNDKNTLLVLKEEVREAIDRSNSGEVHLSSDGPNEVRAKYHGEVAAGHLVQVTPIHDLGT